MSDLLSTEHVIVVVSLSGLQEQDKGHSFDASNKEVTEADSEHSLL